MRTQRLYFVDKISKSVADPGFPREVHQPQMGYQPIIWQIFRQKLHENERTWTEVGGIPSAPLRYASAS